MMRDNGIRKHFPPQEKTVRSHSSIRQPGKGAEGGFQAARLPVSSPRTLPVPPWPIPPPAMKSTAGTAFSRRFRAALSGQAAMYLFASCSPIPSGVEYIFPTPSLPMEFFILLLVLGLLSGMVFTFVKACQVVSLEQKVRTLETEVSGLKERLNSRSSHQRPPAETRKSLPPPCGKSGAVHPYASCRRPGTGTRLRPSLPAQPAAGPERQARTVAPRVLFLGILHRRQAALLDRRVCAVSGNRVLRQVQH